jgi:hypothetical protein
VDDIARPSAATSASRQSTPPATADGASAAPSRTAARCPSRRSAAQRPQPPRLELEADDEQHQHDAELGEVQDLAGSVTSAAPRADQDAAPR